MDDLLLLVTNAYDNAEIVLIEKIQYYVLLGMDEDEALDTLTGKKLQQLRQLRDDAIKVLRQLATMDDAVKQGIIEVFLAGNTAGGNIQGSSDAAFNHLLADYMKLLQGSRFQILRQVQDAYRRIIAEVVQQSSLGVSTRIQTARQALTKFAGEGITGFVSKDGRNWEISTYVSMATRTTLSNAQREGRLRNIDGDLIVINSVPNPSPLCAPYERKVLSISGKDSRYPSLQSAKDEGLFHPQCRHSFTKYIPGLTKLSRDNNDDTEHYEETQDQRYLERQVRAWKRRLAVADTPEAKNKARDRISSYQDKITELTEEFDLVRKKQRESIISAR